MIAPIRPPRGARTATQLASARRAVADFFFGPAGGGATASAPPVSRLLAWLFVGWTIAVVTFCLTRGTWWGKGP